MLLDGTEPVEYSLELSLGTYIASIGFSDRAWWPVVSAHDCSVSFTLGIDENFLWELLNENW